MKTFSWSIRELRRLVELQCHPRSAFSDSLQRQVRVPSYSVLEYSVPLSDSGKRRHGPVEMVPRVSSRNLHADAGLALRDDGEAEADHVDALGGEVAGQILVMSGRLAWQWMSRADPDLVKAALRTNTGRHDLSTVQAPNV